jgi:hypothetical protein
LSVAERRQRQRQPRERRDRAQHLEDRIQCACRPLAAANEHAEPDAADRREEIAERNALQARVDMPEQTLVDAAAVVERVDD